MDDFGLFREVRNRRIRVYTSEKISKYLLTFRYIPTNFDGLIVGPSLSDELDPAKIEGFRIYNLSLAGGNISQIRLCCENVLRRGNIKLLIVCLDPYLTRETGLNDRRLTPGFRWSTLGSTFTFQLYGDKIQRAWSPQKDTFADSYNGKCNLARKNMLNHVDARREIDLFAALLEKNNSEVPLCDKAFQELDELLRMARSRNVRVVAFYYPLPYKVFLANKTNQLIFQEKIGALFNRHEIACDFNSDDYLSFRQDYANYSDHGHLSVKGAEYICSELNRLICNAR